ncbi:MAG: aspartyl/asparaginyl beta-hydroxylase domain-containing protein [Geminicoccaceae bacterium]
MLAYGAHSATESILFKQEWHLSAAQTSLGHMEDMIWSWAKGKGLDPHAFLPILREETDLWPVYTFPDWLTYRDVLEPLVASCLKLLGKPGGIVTRLALVRLPGGAHIKPHVDGHLMAERAHRLHVSLSRSPSVVYKIDGRKFTMQEGHVYDFNNRVRHSVRNEGRQPRVNLFVDYYPNPGPAIRNPLADLPPVFAPPTPRLA